MTIALTYAMTLGLVAAVNPCGFPLLPAYLAYFAGGDSAGTGVQRAARGLRAGLLVTLGFVAVFGMAGVLIEAGLPLIVAWVPWVMVLVGLGLATLGLITIIRGHFSLRLPTTRLGEGRTALTMIGFGVTYAIASLSCSLPLFLAGIAGAFTRESVGAGLANFVAYAVGMGVFVTVASVVAALLGAATLRRVRPLARFAPRIAAGIAIVVGLYLAYYWIDDLLEPLSTPPITAFVNSIQSAIADWISGAALPIAACLIVATLAACVFVAIGRRIRRADSSPLANPLEQSENV